MTKISCIVCTYRNPDTLRKTLRSLTEQILPAEDYEVIIVDNNSQDKTEAITRSLIDAGHHNIHYVLETRIGLSQARNTGINIAKAPIIAFIDDDAEADPAWLSTLLNVYETYPDVWAVGGRVDGTWEAPRPDWLPDHMLRALSLIDWGDEARPLQWPERIIGVNCSFRRVVFEEIGYFDLNLGRRGHLLIGNEDTEIQERIHKLEKQVYYTPHALVYHLVPASRLRKTYFYRRGIGHGRSQVLLIRTQQGDDALREEAQNKCRALKRIIKSMVKKLLGKDRRNSWFGLCMGLSNSIGFLYQYLHIKYIRAKSYDAH